MATATGTLNNRRLTPLGFLNLIVLTLFTFLCIYPLYYILINSFSASGEVIKGVFLAPRGFTTESYTSMMNIAGIESSVFVSIARTLSGSILTLFCSSFVAYILTHKDMPVRKVFYRYFIVTMYINAGFIPFYILISRLGLINNFLVYILPTAVQAFFIILIKTYIESIPGELGESAEIDGAGIVSIYFNIILPLSKPILACIFLFAAVNQWNSWADNLFFMQGSRARNLHTLQFLLYQNLQSNMSAAIQGGSARAGDIRVTPQTLRMAMTFVTVLPILCIYPFIQRYFSSGIMLGAVKG